MKKLLFLLSIIVLFSCAKPQCRTCTKVYYSPIAATYFDVCTDEEYQYWNNRDYIEYIYGIHTEVKIICK